jgi:hypothetical protein
MKRFLVLLFGICLFCSCGLFIQSDLDKINGDWVFDSMHSEGVTVSWSAFRPYVYARPEYTFYSSIYQFNAINFDGDFATGTFDINEDTKILGLYSTSFISEVRYEFEDNFVIFYYDSQNWVKYYKR